MSELLTFLNLGFHHVASPGALDHILFLLVLAAIYRWREWRSAIWVVTAFTVGHSITLALVVTGLLHLPMPLIEFLIPVTIVATAVDNIVGRARTPEGQASRYRPLFAGVFGLVHGAGFANYLASMFPDHVAVPLLGFNVGIELGQCLILALSVAACTAVDAAARRLSSRATVRLRVVTVSAVVAVVAMGWAAERAPW